MVVSNLIFKPACIFLSHLFGKLLYPRQVIKVNCPIIMRQEALSSHPEFRYKAQYLKRFQQMGYKGDPAEENLPKIDALTFDDIVKFYEENIKGKPYAIGIMGNPKDIDLKKLEKYGKVVRVNERKLFNAKDTLF